jgi:hypothetical protein
MINVFGLLLGDLDGDGDSKLCVCDMDKKLQVYKGKSMINQEQLLDVPVAMCIIYTDYSMVGSLKF